LQEGDVDLVGPAVDLGGKRTGGLGIAFVASQYCEERLLGQRAQEVTDLLA
jgi:hypothetical protein